MNRLSLTATAIVFLFAAFSNFCFGQEDLSKFLEQDTVPASDYVSATFKTTRIINMHSLETVGKRTLDFRISHRFGDWNSGGYNMYGLDGPASIRLGLEYSYDGRWMIGFGRSSVDKMLDGFLKLRLLRQTTSDSKIISITAVSSMNYTTLTDPNILVTGIDKYQYASSRMSFVNELIFGRKFSRNLSIQSSLYMVHFNIVNKITDHNDVYAVGIAGRYKITKRMALSAEYAYRINKYTQDTYYNPLGFGIDIETGGHVFQIQMVNSFAITEGQVIPYTTTSWTKMGIRIGFNISRVFKL